MVITICIFRPTGEETLEKLQGLVIPGDVVITLGAGNIWQVGEALLQALK